MPPPDVQLLRSITLDASRRVLDAGIRRAEDLGLAVCITVCDVGGEPTIAARMDGAPRLSAAIATDKAWTVTAFRGVPTNAWWDLIKDEPALLHGITKTPRLTIFAGGVPLVVGDDVVGAVGVSGGSADQDHDVATAAARAIR